MNEDVGVCGLFCSFCKLFRRKNNRCFGCDWVNKQLKKVRDTHRGCVFWECARDKKVECCLLCDDFPCKIHYESEEAVYTKYLLDMLKEMDKTGYTFQK